MKKLNLLEKKLNINEDNYSFIKDKNGNVVEIEIYDDDYSEIKIDGDVLIELLGVFNYLKRIEIFINDCIINDISKLSNLRYLEDFSLGCGATTISDISVFSQLPNIKKICIPDAKIIDLTPLKDCVKLELLEFFNNKIHNIDCLGNLKELHSLDIGWNEVEDVTILKNFEKLKVLKLNNNKIKDLSSIKFLTDIIYINLQDNEIDNLDFLEDKTKLVSLHFDNNFVNNCDVISNYNELVYLSFENNQIASISALNNLKKINQLSISNNPIIHISPIFNLKNLDFLKANDIKINDFKGFETLIKLRYLFLDNCDITDVVFLCKNIKIQTLSLNDNYIEDVSLLLDNHIKIKTLRLKNNKLNNPFPIYKFYDLDELDLRGNQFGNQLYVKYIGNYNQTEDENAQVTFEELSKLIEEYYMVKGEYDEALAFCNLEYPSRNQLLIYSNRFIETNEFDSYYLNYYFSKCNQLINSIRSVGKENIDDLIQNIKTKIESLTLQHKGKFMESIEQAKYFLYNPYVEFFKYSRFDLSGKINWEILYLLGKNLSRRESLMKSISIYKKLKNANHPLSARLYTDIRYCLRMNFAYTENERKEHDDFMSLLNNIEEAEVIHFDYLQYIQSQQYELKFYSQIHLSSEPCHLNNVSVRRESSSGQFEISLIILLLFFCFLGMIYVLFLVYKIISY